MLPPKEFALNLLQVASGFVGVDRARDEVQIAKFLALFGLDEHSPYCAAGVSYCAAKAYAELAGVPFVPEDSVQVFRSLMTPIRQFYFEPSASCSVIAAEAKSDGKWLSNAQSDSIDILPGWLVLFDWDGDGRPDHIEIVESADDQLHTIGFNTRPAHARAGDESNGGAVARRTRSYDAVLGFVALYQ